jgi:lauroyl/myristoyl acyltransferase
LAGKFAIAAAGRVCVACLSALRRLPSGVTGRLLSPALRLYPLLRPRHAARLKACFAAAPLRGPLSLRDYYSTRLRLMLRGLAFHGKPFPAAAPGAETGKSDRQAGADLAASAHEWTPELRVIVYGERHYREALERNQPIALIGLHAGMVELLHRIPEAPEGRPFLILTAPAFSPPLTRFMARGREMEGKRILWVGKSEARGGQRGLEQGLRSVIASKGVLALMADQHPGPADECEYLMLWDRVRVPWPARLIRFLAAQGFQCLPVSTRMMREDAATGPEGPMATARFEFHPVLPQADAEGIRAFLEKAIAEAPEQWNWSYPKVDQR